MTDHGRDTKAMTAPDPKRVREMIAELQEQRRLLAYTGGAAHQAALNRFAATLHDAAPNLLAAAEAWADAQARIAELESEKNRLRNLVAGFVALRDAVAEAGGMGGPLEQETIERFAPRHIELHERARAELATLEQADG